MFRKFLPIDGDDRSGVASSGARLTVCKRIVEAHGGRIWAESERPGMGAQFTFTVPMTDDDGHAGRGRQGRSPSQSRSPA